MTYREQLKEQILKICISSGKIFIYPTINDILSKDYSTKEAAIATSIKDCTLFIKANREWL